NQTAENTNSAMKKAEDQDWRVPIIPYLKNPGRGAERNIRRAAFKYILIDDELYRRMLALLKYPFYPLFNFDNGMNLISESLIILTSAQLLVVFAFAHIFWRYFVFCRFLTNFG